MRASPLASGMTAFHYITLPQENVLQNDERVVEQGGAGPYASVVMGEYSIGLFRSGFQQLVRKEISVDVQWFPACVRHR